MKKVLFASVLLATLLFSGDYEDGQKAYEAGSYKKAIELFKKADKQGHIEAIVALGIMYENGQGVQQDLDKALKLYKIGIDRGSDQAKLLSMMLMFKILDGKLDGQ